jgi:hypothetical protein
MNSLPQFVRFAALQLALCALALALGYLILPSDWHEAVRALPRAAMADLKAMVHGAAAGALVRDWAAVTGDPVFWPWICSGLAVGTGLALATHLLFAGRRPAWRYGLAALVATLVPALLWAVLPLLLMPVALVATIAAQLAAWALLGARPQNQLHDVHENAAWLSALKKPYDVHEHLGKGVFIGLRPGPRGRRTPVSLAVEVLHKNHVALIGASGVGKSKLAALILRQLLAAGDALSVFDPKDDEFFAGILAKGAQDAGLPFVYINLRQAVPQLNPFVGCSAEEIALLLQAGLGLDPSGDPAVDFHRGNDREACGRLVASGGRHMLELVELGADIDQVTKAVNFWRELQQLAWVRAFHCEDGPDLAGTLAAGGIVYVVGDTDDLRIVAAQKLLLARVTQIIKARPRAGARQVALMLDEYKYMLSNAALRALGTIRDKRCNLLLAFQSHGDLADCGALNPIAVRGAADNCTLNFIYKLQDRRTAEDFVKMAGDERVALESIDRREADKGSRHEANRQAVSIDMLTTNAPKPLGPHECSVSWVFGLGPAFPLSTSHLPAGPTPRVSALPEAGAAQSRASAADAQTLLPSQPEPSPTSRPESCATALIDFTVAEPDGDESLDFPI